MSVEVKSGATSDLWTVDPTSKAARITPYDPLGRIVAPQSKATFFATALFTPPATPTDMVTIYGSASKTVRIISFKITTTNTAAGSQTFYLLRRSSVNTTGTFVAGTPVQADTTDAAATATVGHYTANPGGLGTLVGNISIVRRASTVLVPATFAGIAEDAGFDLLDWMTNSLMDKLLTLNGTSQGICLNFNGAALVSGQVHIYRLVWIEE